MLRNFIPNLITVIMPLSDLKRNMSYGHDQNPDTQPSTKDLISRAPEFFDNDLHKELSLAKDACEYGLGAALIYERHICKTFLIRH